MARKERVESHTTTKNERSRIKIIEKKSDWGTGVTNLPNLQKVSSLKLLIKRIGAN